MTPTTQQREVTQVGRPALAPMPHMVALAPGGGGAAAHTPHIADHQRAAQARRHQALGAPELQRHLPIVEHDLC